MPRSAETALRRAGFRTANATNAAGGFTAGGVTGEDKEVTTSGIASSSGGGVADDTSDVVDGLLPLAGDYVGLGGPDAVPLETDGPFVPHAALHGGMIDELFLNPDAKLGAMNPAP